MQSAIPRNPEIGSFEVDEGKSGSTGALFIITAKRKTMNCKRCPHLVRHGHMGKSGNIEFLNNCGLLMKAETLELGADSFKKPGRKPTKKPERPPNRPPPKMPDKSHGCSKYPFDEDFDYFFCDVYASTFKGGDRKFGVNPTGDFQYSDVVSSGMITDMELL